MINNIFNIFSWQRFVEWLEPIFTKANGEILFTNIEFWFVFVIFFAFYLLSLHARRRWVMLAYTLLFNLFFAWKISGWVMLIMPATILLTWLMTQLLRQTEGAGRSWILAIDIILTLVPLVVFRYSNMLISGINELMQSNFPLIQLIVPVGISFYTLQAISYAVDVYRKRFTTPVDLLEYSFYLTFFPLLLAGPITRAETLIPQIKSDQRPDDNVVYNGMWLIMLGLIKKCLFADYIAIYNNWIFEDPTGYSGFETLIAMMGYIVQIYYDFSGYSDISIGIAALLGFQLRDNFNFPFKALNITDFWRRWHISLSSWIRDYIYIPLGGNRNGKILMCFNLLFAMTIAGLWHGANLTFIVWGLLNGIMLTLHKLAKPALDHIPDNWLIKPISITLTFTFISLTMAFFGAVNIDESMLILKHGFSNFDIAYFIPFCQARPLWMVFVVGGLILHLTSSWWYEKTKRYFIEAPWIVKIIIIIAVVQIIINFSNEDIQPFIYMKF